MYIVTSCIPLCTAITTGALKLKITPINENYVVVEWLWIHLHLYYMMLTTTSWIREPNYSIVHWCKITCVFQNGLSHIYCRVLSIFPTIFVLIPEYYWHHTGFIHCSFDWPPKDDHIFDCGLPKNDHILKAQQPILPQNMEKLLTILFEHQ